VITQLVRTKTFDVDAGWKYYHFEALVCVPRTLTLKNLFSPPTQLSIHVFCMIAAISSDYFPKQH
jgi:hypothetical protein